VASSDLPGFDDTSVALKATRLIGIVGYSPVLDVFPLSALLVDELRRKLPVDGSIAIEDMSWGPIHVVQRFQDPEAKRPQRLVLVGAASVSAEPGRVRAFRWRGGKLPPEAVQERIYEAVTGVVDIENTLVIGEHFGIWPDECFVVEADMPAETFGCMVMADSEKRAQDPMLARQLGFSPVRMRRHIAAAAAALAMKGAKARVPLEEKFASALPANAKFMRNRFTFATEDDRTDGQDRRRFGLPPTARVES
jgi:hypothetical protein